MEETKSQTFEEAVGRPNLAALPDDPQKMDGGLLFERQSLDGIDGTSCE